VTEETTAGPDEPKRLLGVFRAEWAVHPFRRPSGGRLLRAVRTHLLFAIALTGGAYFRWAAVRGYPGVLWFTGDSYFYLGRALRPDQPSPSKTLGYSFALRLLEPFHSFTLVAVVQHLMGLSIAVMIYALLRRVRLPGWLATIAALPVLYDAYTIELEHLLMSETLFVFLIFAGLTLLLWRIRGPRPWPAWWLALPAGLLLGYAVLVRSAGAPLVPAIMAVLLLPRRGWFKLRVGAWLPAIAFAAAAAVPIVAYASWFHAERGSYALTTSDGLYMWGRVAEFADCEKIKPPPAQRPLCMDPALKAEHDAPGHLIWRSDVPPRQLYASAITPENNKTLRDFALHAMIAQPGDYRQVITDGLGKAFSTHRFPYPTSSTEQLYHFPDHPHTFPGGRSWGGGGSALSDAMNYGRQFHPSRVSRPYADRMITYQRNVYMPGPVLGVLFCLPVLGIAFGRQRRAVLLTWGTAATLLLFPIASADFDYRYVVPTIPFVCLAAGLSLARGERRDDEEARPRVITRWSGSRDSRPREKDPATVP